MLLWIKIYFEYGTWNIKVDLIIRIYETSFNYSFIVQYMKYKTLFDWIRMYVFCFKSAGKWKILFWRYTLSYDDMKVYEQRMYVQP